MSRLAALSGSNGTAGAPLLDHTVDENLMQYVEMNVRDKVLHVRTTRSVRPTHSIRLALTSNALEGASFSGPHD